MSSRFVYMCILYMEGSVFENCICSLKNWKNFYKKVLTFVEGSAKICLVLEKQGQHKRTLKTEQYVKP